MVADVAAGVALALDGGRDSSALSGVLAQDDPLALAAIRVLGADVLAPYALRAGGGPGTTTDTGTDMDSGMAHRRTARASGVGAGPAARGARADGEVVRKALAAYPPGADASEVSLWSYRGLVEASRAYLPAGQGGPESPAGAGDRAAGPAAVAGWLQADPWPQLAHRASQLAALSLPGLAPALATGLAARTEDLSRGFVRAVRRRDWLQAAGIGRWLARVPDVPDTLGLDTGLVYVLRMSGGDARVALHTAIARRFHGRGAR
nr:hypothetical protein [Actinacidiphila yanglinensis]